MLLFQAEMPQITSPLIQIVIKQPEVEQPPEEKIYTIEEKIKLNYYNCNEAVEWIRADTAECLTKSVVTARTTEKPVRRAVNASGNTYSAGFCTAYVKNQLSWVPNGWGNANRWASNARSQGYTVSSVPVVGAVAQTSSGPLGHVAVVVSVNDTTVTISEMNYKARYVVSTRTVPISNFTYIY